MIVWGLLIRPPEEIIFKPEEIKLINTQVEINYPHYHELKSARVLNFATGNDLSNFADKAAITMKAGEKNKKIVTVIKHSNGTQEDLVIKQYQPLLHMQFDFSEDQMALIDEIKVIALGPDFTKDS